MLPTMFATDISSSSLHPISLSSSPGTRFRSIPYTRLSRLSLVSLAQDTNTYSKAKATTYCCVSGGTSSSAFIPATKRACIFAKA